MNPESFINTNEAPPLKIETKIDDIETQSPLELAEENFTKIDNTASPLISFEEKLEL